MEAVDVALIEQVEYRIDRGLTRLFAQVASSNAQRPSGNSRSVVHEFSEVQTLAVSLVDETWAYVLEMCKGRSLQPDAIAIRIVPLINAVSQRVRAYGDRRIQGAAAFPNFGWVNAKAAEASAVVEKHIIMSANEASLGFANGRAIYPEAEWPTVWRILKGSEMEVDYERLRQVRDQVLRYIYENGAHMPSFSVDPDVMQRKLGISGQELSAVTMVLMNQGMLPEPRTGIVGMIGLGPRGQAEAEALGPKVLLRDPPPPSSINASGDNSIFQIAGAGSHQTASNSNHHEHILKVLEQIENEIPSLKLDDAQRREAKDLVDALKQSTKGNIPAAGLRAMAFGLSTLLTGAGSQMGKLLLDKFLG